jgi:hypothetical protein
MHPGTALLLPSTVSKAKPPATHLVAADFHVCLVGCVHLVAKAGLEVRAGTPEGAAEGVLMVAKHSEGRGAISQHTHFGRIETGIQLIQGLLY